MYQYLITKNGEGFIKLPSENKFPPFDKYYSLEEVLMSQSLQNVMLNKYNSLD